MASNRINLNLVGSRCVYRARGMNTLRFAVFFQGPGTSAAWAVAVYARLAAGGPLVALGVSYTYANEGGNSGPHDIPACEEIVVAVATPESTGAGAQSSNWARVEAVLTREP